MWSIYEIIHFFFHFFLYFFCTKWVNNSNRAIVSTGTFMRMGLFRANVWSPSQCPRFFSNDRSEKFAGTLSDCRSTYGTRKLSLTWMTAKIYWQKQVTGHKNSCHWDSLTILGPISTSKFSILISIYFQRISWENLIKDKSTRGEDN